MFTSTLIYKVVRLEQQEMLVRAEKERLLNINRPQSEHPLARLGQLLADIGCQLKTRYTITGALEKETDPTCC